MFDDMVRAAEEIVVPRIAGAAVHQILQDGEVKYGNCSLRREGAQMSKKGFLSLRHTCISWRDVGTHLDGDYILIYNRRQPWDQIILSTREVYNAAAIPEIAWRLKNTLQDSLA